MKREVKGLYSGAGCIESLVRVHQDRILNDIMAPDSHSGPWTASPSRSSRKTRCSESIWPAGRHTITPFRPDQNTIALPLSPDVRLQMIAVDDIGAIAAMAFEHTGHWQGRQVDLAGDEISMTEIAQALGRVQGREVRYMQVPWTDFERQMGQEFARMFRWMQETGFHADIPALRAEYPSLMSSERWLHSKLQPV